MFLFIIIIHHILFYRNMWLSLAPPGSATCFDRINFLVVTQGSRVFAQKMLDRGQISLVEPNKSKSYLLLNIFFYCLYCLIEILIESVRYFLQCASIYLLACSSITRFKRAFHRLSKHLYYLFIRKFELTRHHGIDKQKSPADCAKYIYFLAYSDVNTHKSMITQKLKKKLVICYSLFIICATVPSACPCT